MVREIAYNMTPTKKGFYYYDDVVEVQEVVKLDVRKVTFKELDKLRISAKDSRLAIQTLLSDPQISN